MSVLFEAFSAAKNEAAKKELGNAFFRSNPDVLFVKSEDTGLLLNPSCEVSENKIGELIKETDTIYANTSKTFDFPSILFSYKYGPSNAVKTGTVGLNVASLCELMGTGSNNTTILVDENAKILINPDFGSTKTERSEIRSLVKDLAKNSEESNTQTVIDGVFTAVHQIKDNLFVITTISEKSVYAVINRTTYRIILFSLAVLFIAIILIRIFSNGITNPIKELVEASSKIGQNP